MDPWQSWLGTVLADYLLQLNWPIWFKHRWRCTIRFCFSDNAAMKCIPQTSGLPGRRRVPWWNTECRNARKQQNKAWRLLRDSPTAENLESFKKMKSQGRRTRRQARRESWHKFLSGVTSYTQETKVWNMASKVAGRHASSLPLADTQGDTLEDQGNSLGAHFEEVSSSSH